MTKLNPTAPVFTPSSSPAASSYRLNPAVRRGGGGGAFVPRPSADADDDSAPASPADSAGPATPSPLRSAFAIAFAARVARDKGGGRTERPPSFPLVGKMRMVQPQDVVDGERRAGEVFVFF
jgi:hypothetical protein